MTEELFDPIAINKMNNLERLLDLPPEYIWDKLNLDAADVIVDIGAGTGFFSIPFSNHAKRVFACDISDAMHEWMKNNLCPIYPNIIPLEMDDPVSVPLKDGIADLVYMIELHHELDEPEKMLADCRRLLKQNGMIFISDWKKQDMYDGPPIDLRCLPDEVAAQLKGAGFKNIVIYGELNKHFLVVAENR